MSISLRCEAGGLEKRSDRLSGGNRTTRRPPPGQGESIFSADPLGLKEKIEGFIIGRTYHRGSPIGTFCWEPMKGKKKEPRPTPTEGVGT